MPGKLAASAPDRESAGVRPTTVFFVSFINCFVHLFLLLHFTDSLMEKKKMKNEMKMQKQTSGSLFLLASAGSCGVCSFFTFLIFTH